MPPYSQLPVVAVTGLTFEARIAAGPGVVTVCGGGHLARLKADLTEAISRGCRGIVSFGIAGGLAEHLQPGACIIARSIVTPAERFESHLEWASHLLQNIPGSVHADIAGASAPVCTPADKLALGRATNSVAVDMESLLCATLAKVHSLPFAAVRVVADPSHRALPPAAQINLLPGGKPDMRGGDALRDRPPAPDQGTGPRRPRYAHGARRTGARAADARSWIWARRGFRAGHCSASGGRASRLSRYGTASISGFSSKSLNFHKIRSTLCGKARSAPLA